ncbi:MAG: sulfite reductase subunit beta, partial [Chitinophagaceae bacterium]
QALKTHSRLKYTLDRIGVEPFKAELAKRCGFALEPAQDYAFTSRKDHYGWKQNVEGDWYYTVFVENGRVLDDPKLALKTALLTIAKTGKANFRFTGNQNVIIADVKPADKDAIDSILKEFKLDKHTDEAGVLRKNAMACVALPTCPLALAEGQRYLPKLISLIEPIITKYQLDAEDIILRMTGCPNGCGRPYAAEIGFVGTAPGRYNLHIGGDNEGTRLNKIFKESLDESSILNELDGLFASFKNEKKKGETFSDFSMRKNWV